MNVFLFSGILAVVQTNVTWYLIPLSLSISLVYTASRYEDTKLILIRTARLFMTILLFMGAISLLLLGLSLWL